MTGFLGLFPEVLNVNGDLENVAVLARRAGGPVST